MKTYLFFKLITLFSLLFATAKYYRLKKAYDNLSEQHITELKNGTLYLVKFTKEEKDILNMSIEEHIRLLTQAGIKEQDKGKKAKYLLTRNTMYNIQKKLCE